MSFILVPAQGSDIQINAWHWRPTLELIRASGLLSEEEYQRMGAQGCAGQVDAMRALRIADIIDAKLASMTKEERMRADLTTTTKPKMPITPSSDSDDAYSTNYSWLVTFRDFCRRCKGFKVV